MCKTGFGIINKECTACDDANAANCDGNKAEATKCKPGYILANKKCD